MNINKIIIIFLTLFLISLNISLPTHASELMFYSLTTSNGLSQTSINYIYQDSSDYIWVGTKNGLNRYNGFKFEIYNKGFSEKRNIVDSHITCLNEDLKNNLWVGTLDGLSKINLKTEEITNYTVANSSLSSNKIMDIKINNNGDIIVATSNGLNIYDDNNDNFISLVNQDFRLSSSNMSSIDFYNDNYIYMISKNHLLKYDITNAKYSIIKSLTEDTTLTTLSLSEDTIYLGTEYDGIYTYNIKTEEINHEYTLYINGNSGPSYTVNYIYNCNSEIYVGSTNGLYIFKEKNLLNHFTNESYDEYSLIDNYISYIMKDSNGLLWIGTFSGINTVDCYLGISYYNNFIYNQNSKNNIIVGTYEDVNENLWLGVYGNGINILDKKNNTITLLNTKTDNKLNSDTIWDIKGNEKYVFATSSVGLNVINIETLQIQNLLENKFCHTLYVDGDYLWVGTLGGFDIINLNDFSIKSINKLLAENNITVNLGGAIFKDSHDTYWLGGAKKEGLIHFDPNNNSIKLFKYAELENNISDNTILSISEDSKGNLWFGTESALNKYNRLTEEFTIYSIEDGLSNNTIYSIIPSDDKVWISTNSGINCLEFKDNQLINVNYDSAFLLE